MSFVLKNAVILQRFFKATPAQVVKLVDTLL